MKKLFFWLFFALSLAPLLFNLSSAHAERGNELIPDHYIVVFKESVADPELESDEMTARHGLGKKTLYRHALKGFAAMIPPAKLDAVKNDPRVAFVSQERIFHTTVQTEPTGIDRINAEIPRAGGWSGFRLDNGQPVDVAVIDTGIDLTHPDLAAHIGGSINFINRSRNGNDDNGHGSHVAGIIGAINNSQGVVGVAPNVRLWAVKVLDSTGSGSTSTVIAGIDWVTASRSDPNREPIEVANMSLGSGGRDDGNCGLNNGDALHRAICRSVAAGVTYVVAAGNDGKDASGFAPAAYPEVITVSALVDTDGKPGGQGPSTAYGNDDSFASFSNYGSVVDVIAPGVNIYSTYKNGGYATLSGTSMAAPHATGSAALFISTYPQASPDLVRRVLVGKGVLDWNTATDRDSIHEPRVDACRSSGMYCP